MTLTTHFTVSENGERDVFLFFHLSSVYADVMLCNRAQIPEFLLVMCHWASYLFSLSFTLLI